MFKYLLLCFGSLLLFTFLSCNSAKTVKEATDGAAQTSPPAAMMSGEMLILLADKVKPDVIVEAFNKFGLEHAGQASRSQNKHKFTFKETGFKAEEMLSAINAHEGVKSAVIIAPKK